MFKRLASLLLGSKQDAPMDREAFAAYVMAQLPRYSPGEQFTYVPEKFEIRGSSGLTTFLGNVYADYCKADSADRGEHLDRFMQGFALEEAPDDFARACPQLLPVMRNLSGLECLNLADEKQAERDIMVQFAMTRFSPELGVGIAFDTEFAVAQVGEKKLATWGVTQAEALAVAIDNLRHKVAPSFAELAPGLYIADYGDYYDAARIVLPELAWQLKLNGQPVVMAPCRTGLLVAGDQDEAAMEGLLAVADKMFSEETRLLSAEMFRLGDTGWQLWEPAGDLGVQLRNMQRRLLAADYEAQQTALREGLEKRGEDVFVATYKLMKKQGENRLSSMTVVSKGITSLIPQTDVVAFFIPETEETIFVDWDKAMSVAEALFVKQGHVLPRYRVEGFPDDGQLAQLRTLAG